MTGLQVLSIACNLIFYGCYPQAPVLTFVRPELIFLSVYYDGIDSSKHKVNSV